VLDEPFTGLDYEAAMSVTKELVQLRLLQHTASLLILHLSHLTKVVVMDFEKTKQNHSTQMKARPRNPVLTSNLVQSRIADAARHRQFHPNSHRQQHRLMLIVIEQHQKVLFNDIVPR
jgi:ABC-type sulfate/molybdate transport systems ATPase subunit